MRDPLRREVACEDVSGLECNVRRAERVLPEEAQAVLRMMQVVALEDVDLCEHGAQTAEAVLLVREAGDAEAVVGPNVDVSLVIGGRRPEPLQIGLGLINPVSNALLHGHQDVLSGIYEWEELGHVVLDVCCQMR